MHRLNTSVSDVTSPVPTNKPISAEKCIINEQSEFKYECRRMSKIILLTILSVTFGCTGSAFLAYNLSNQCKKNT